MEKIIILGSSGFLGRILCQFFSANSNFELFPLSRKDVDFTNSDLLKQRVLEISPDYIIHSAVSLENFGKEIKHIYVQGKKLSKIVGGKFKEEKIGIFIL